MNGKQSRTRDIGGVEVPDAQSFRVHFCGHCPSAHLIFRNVDQEIICHATMSAAQARRLFEQIVGHDPNFKDEAP